MSGEPQHLVILRGNSASGKTTLARELQLAMGRGTANIGQDHLRRVVLREHDRPDADNIGLIENTVRYCLGIGYHVILEGILRAGHYAPMLRRLLGEHSGPRHVFYLDVPLTETLRRHAGRPLAAEVTDTQLRQWHLPGDVLGVPGEVVLGGHLGPAEALDALRQQIGPVVPRPQLPPAHFR
ncbi:AAA family ATPase [Propionicimonas sp.]|uniref:AAA family ATPase n=1 Tax=Propionicimonas sp. TaxID=1955623 RepID=UPI0039E6D9DC